MYFYRDANQFSKWFAALSIEYGKDFMKLEIRHYNIRKNDKQVCFASFLVTHHVTFMCIIILNFTAHTLLIYDVAYI